eukprot:9335307-Prorocentrum_lima.AAC.1
MTSSLVGSEMCIRDSGEAAARGGPRQCSKRERKQARLESEKVQRHVGPVSYTHLTLPTICSV